MIQEDYYKINLKIKYNDKMIVKKNGTIQNNFIEIKKN